MRSTVLSSKARPTICIDSGRPDAEKPVGIDIAGLPVTLNGMVWIGQVGGVFGSISEKAGAGIRALALIKAVKDFSFHVNARGRSPPSPHACVTCASVLKSPSGIL